MWSSDRTLAGALAGAVSIACASSAFAGDLNPPSGPVAPTGKTLVEVEPRTALTATNTPGDADAVFRITAPGSYYLVENLSAPAGFNGIEIAANDVTIDLNGFQLIGAANSLSAIVDSPSTQNVRVFNGILRNWGALGVSLSQTVSAEVHHLTIQTTGLEGIFAGSRAVIRDCVLRDTGRTGIFVQGDAFEISRNNITGAGFADPTASFAAIFVDTTTTNGLILDNFFANNEFGLFVQGSGHTFGRNIAKLNLAGNYSFNPLAHHFGALATLPGAGPWDNLSN